jgi:hypothetical protein
MRRDDLTGSLNAVDLWHADVHEDDVRLEANGGLDCFGAIGRLTDNFEVLFLLDNHAQPMPQQLLVVDE